MEHPDNIVNDPCLKPYWGWHSDHNAGPYLPAIQQDRTEFLNFLKLLDFEGNALTIGLSMGGGMHLLFTKLFKTAVTIDINAALIRHWQSIIPGILLAGNCNDVSTIDAARTYAPYNLIFIDGDHTYHGVMNDHRDYAEMVKPGGIMGFHDYNSTYYPGVTQAIDELRTDHPIEIIEPHSLGIAWYRK